MTVAVPQSACSRCGTLFTCGMTAGQTACWCAELPRLQEIDPAATCLCPSCLGAALATSQAPRAAIGDL